MTPRPPRLLLVDDNEDNIFTLTRRLKSFVSGEMVAAANGRQALEALRAGPFDLVLLDLLMPEMDGATTLEHIKADMALRDIPVIMISAVNELETTMRCIKLGAEDYIPKPFNADLLRVRVEAALERKRLRDQEAALFERVQAEKARADGLLESLLPKSVAAELKANGRLAPRRHDSVAVLICDVVGFTAYCDRHPPERVVEDLSALVGALEPIVERHGLEKIKTIGDALMATGGLMRHVENPARAAAECGLALVAAAAATGPGWQVRVGVHVGPVVAGVMGQRNFAFDIWGDTVNVAARAAAEAEPGAVVVTGATWPYLRAGGQGRALGLVDLKGKGKVELVRYLGAKPAA